MIVGPGQEVQRFTLPLRRFGGAFDIRPGRGYTGEEGSEDDQGIRREREGPVFRDRGPGREA